jgi:CheY-like chemotaxis protein/anti-sigma regulatory factor (Ser/Thr protein kinase)
VADAIRVIRRSATHLADLVDGLVDVSRIENGAMRIARDNVNLGDLLSQIVDMFRVQAAARGIEFEYVRPDNLPSRVYTDQKRLRQILINLISNAIKYTPSGSARLGVAWRNPVAEFIVEDTGVGIDAAHLDRIFEPFERIETVRGQPGVGLGLTITRMLVDVMGGQLTVQSRRGEGSTFRLKLYLSEATANEADIAPPLRALDRSAGRKILIVDDDAVHLGMVRDLLTPFGFNLECAASGEAGIAACRRAPPELVIMDIAMPGMDGWSSARLLREEHGEELPILMVSANVHDFHRTRRPDDPHDDYLIKPYEIDALLDRIAMLLDLDPIPEKAT